MAGIVVFIRSMHALGDQLVAYPLLYQLHQQYPNHRVTVVAHDPVGSYYAQLPWVHQFVHATTAAQKYRSIPKDTQIFIALHHSSELYSLLGAFKRWGIANYTALAQRLQHHLGPYTTFTCILGPAETDELAQLQQLNLPNFRLLVSRPLADIADLCVNAKLIVANDCGPSHIAQNTGTPYVGLFNEPNPEWFWQRPNTRAVTPPLGTIDIQSVSIERVEAACCNALKNISTARATTMAA